ncbi:MAG: MerR family transcriptional regulator [Anaerolineales bacterium]|jgi:DNA-binding transcriptional MerR regulator
MAKKGQGPTYNLKAVVRETGIKPDTLRAWERRYGLPEPQRTSGGHRLFTPRDIETLKWLTARQDEGLSISRAIDLWRSIEARGKDPLLAMPYGSTTQAAELTFNGGEAIEELRESWIAACREFHEEQAVQVLNQAFGRFPPERVCLDLLVKGLNEIGEGWYQGELTVQQEHFASALALRRVEALLASAPPPNLPGTVLVACPPEDEHTFSPLVLTYLLRRQGRRALFLGANVPYARFESALDGIKPDLVVMSAHELRTAAALIDFASLLADRGLIFAFGGRIFNDQPELRDRIQGHFLGETLAEAPASIEHLLKLRPESPPASAIPPSYRQALAAMGEKQSELSARLSPAMRKLDLDPNHLTNANLHLTSDFLAALQLGDLKLVASDLSWVRGLLRNYGIPGPALDEYLSAYHQSLSDVIGPDGEPVLSYLETLMNSDDFNQNGK